MADVFNKNPSSFVDMNELFPVLNERTGLTSEQFKKVVENLIYVYNNLASGGGSGSSGGGVVFTPSVDVNGNLSWTNNGGLENPTTVNIRGADGANGVIFTPSIDSAGNLSWTNDGGLTNPDTVNIKGLPGKNGVNGKNVLYVVPNTTFTNDNDSLNNSINSTLIISDVTINPEWRVGDNAIVPYYNTTIEANRILGGEILDMDEVNNSVSIYLMWFIN